MSSLQALFINICIYRLFQETEDAYTTACHGNTPGNYKIRCFQVYFFRLNHRKP